MCAEGLRATRLNIIQLWTLCIASLCVVITTTIRLNLLVALTALQMEDRTGYYFRQIPTIDYDGAKRSHSETTVSQGYSLILL